MGNYRIKLSDMMPNYWLYKLKDMGSSRAKSGKNKKAPPSTSTTLGNLQSQYYYTLGSVPPITPSPDLPRRSMRKKRRPKVCLSSSSVSATCACHDSFRSSSSSARRPLVVHAEPLVVHAKPPLHNGRPRWSRSCCCGVFSSADSDIVIELEGIKEWDKLDRLPNLDGKVSFSGDFDELDDCFRSARIERELELDGVDSVEGDHVFNSMVEMELPPILTKPPKFSDLVLELKQQQPTSRFRRCAKTEVKPARPSHGFAARAAKEDKVAPRRSVSSRGVRIRSNSPRILGKKMQTAYNCRTRRAGEGIAVVKSSSDPLKDFKESMMEMIVENNIRGSKDMEDLLACYLSLNSSEYHDVIVEVFAQIWLDLTHDLPH